MKEIILDCIDKRFPRGDWVLVLGEEKARLLDDEDVQQAEFPHAEAHERVVYPSFTQSVKNLGIVTVRHGTVWFAPKERVIARLREYQASALAALGPDAIRALRRRGRWWLLGGIALLTLAAVGTIVSLANAIGGGGGRAVFGIGILVSGVVLTARGVSILKQAGRAAEEAGIIE